MLSISALSRIIPMPCLLQMSLPVKHTLPQYAGWIAECRFATFGMGSICLQIYSPLFRLHPRNVPYEVLFGLLSEHPRKSLKPIGNAYKTITWAAANSLIYKA